MMIDYFKDSDSFFLKFTYTGYQHTFDVKENDAVAGILITNASRKMDLEGILENGPPTIEFVDRIAEITAAENAAAPTT